jgi:DNA polymerase III sliding clamp (beta) subunit (PCNA family)
MAIAVNETEAAPEAVTVRVDIRELAAAAAFCRKARPGTRSGMVAWRDSVLVNGAYVYGGNPHGAIVSVHVDGITSHRGFTIPYDTIIAAAKGAKGTVLVSSDGSMVRDDGAIFSWGYDSTVVREMQDCIPPTAYSSVQAQYHYDGDTFRSAVATVTPSASKDDSRPVLTGVYLAPNGEWAATDSYRLIVASVPSETVIEGDGGVIVPASMLRLAASVKKAASFTVTIGGNVPSVDILVLCKDDRILCSITERIIDGQYPKYENLVPAGFTATVDCDGDLLRNALKAAANMSKQNAPVTFTLDDSTSTLLVSAGSGETRGEWYVPCLYDSGATDGKLTIGVNAEFAADGANAIGDDIAISVNDPMRPLLMTRPYRGGFDPRYVLMPIRI